MSRQTDIAIVAACVPGMLGSCALVISFLVAETPRQAALQGRHMPPGWAAGVWSGGDYRYAWWTVSDAPLLFALCCAALVSC